jgi:hypothetical protein
VPAICYCDACGILGEFTSETQSTMDFYEAGTLEAIMEDSCGVQSSVLCSWLDPDDAVALRVSVLNLLS